MSRQGLRRRPPYTGFGAPGAFAAQADVRSILDDQDANHQDPADLPCKADFRGLECGHDRRGEARRLTNGTVLAYRRVGATSSIGPCG